MASRNEDVFKALAEGHRRRILSALCAGPMVAGELGRLVGLAPNAVSFHLKWLREAGLVSVQRQGRCLRYHANAAALAEWQTHVESLFATATASGPAGGMRMAPGSAPRDEHLAAGAPEPVADTGPADDSDDRLPTELL